MLPVSSGNTSGFRDNTPVPYAPVSSINTYLCPYTRQQDMTGKKHTTKLVDEKSGLMECLVCGEKYHTTMKADADGKFLPENWECVNKCRLIHTDEKPAHKK
jgi:hypothetical protein